MANSSTSVAIIGMSGLFPEAASLAEFYGNLRAGKDSVRNLSYARISDLQLDPAKAYRVLGYLERIDLFDYAFFGIAKSEAEAMDPVQRLSLELVVKAIENAGYSLKAFSGSNTALYIGGYPYTNYPKLVPESESTALTGNLHAMVAGKIAYALNLCGPAVMVDTACSSSLVALHEACRKVIHGEATCAIAGGINVITAFDEAEGFHDEMGISSAAGRSKAFDAAAEGIGEGEGGGFLILKRLDQALRDKDHVHAVILGSAVNQDGGRSNGVTAPSPLAQTEVILKAWETAGINPESVTYMEAHGTGTQLGDPIEVQGITDAFSRYTSRTRFCAVSALKTNLGHLNNAAGIAGVIKAVLALRHKELLPSLHFHTPNPFIDFDNTAVYVNATLKPWLAGATPRRCGVSSFGLSGTNAHVVLEESTPETAGEASDGDELILKVSAKSLPALKEYLATIHNYLSGTGNALPDVLYTLNTGRDDYAYRLCVTARSKEQLLRRTAERITSAAAENSLRQETPKSTVLLFSDVNHDEKILKDLYRHPVFRQEMEYFQPELARHPGGCAERFAVQYCTYKLLRSLDVPVAVVIGAGIGKVVKQVITGALTLPEALRTLREMTPPDPSVDENKLRASVRQLVAKGEFLFVGVGQGEVMAEKLLAWRPELPGLAVHQLFGGPDASLLAGLAGLYTAGVSLNWRNLYPEGGLQRVEVPVYPFEKTRCWAIAPPPLRRKQMHEWFYALGWKARAIEETVAYAKGKGYLVIMDELGLGKQLTRRLERIGNPCVKVAFADGFSREGEREYRINPRAEGDYERLLGAIAASGIAVDGVIWTADFSDAAPVTVENAEDGLATGVYAQFLLAKACRTWFDTPGFALVHVSSGAQRVGSEAIDPAKHMSAGLFKALLTAYPTLKVSSIDLDPDPDFGDAVEHIIEEISAYALQTFVAYREGLRYVPEITTVPVAPGTPASGTTFKAGGVYLITGGASGIGAAVCRLLASQARCTILVVGRTVLPAPEAWAETIRASGVAADVREKVAHLLALHRKGAEVAYYAAEVGDEGAMAAVFADIAGRYGRLDGIIHSAGVAGDWVPLEQLDLESFKKVLSPKVQGTLLLAQLSAALRPDLFVMFSSLNSIVPQRNSLAYTAANAFEDAFALALASAGKSAVAINWGAWAETGLGKRVEVDSYENLASAMRAWKTDEGMQAFQVALQLEHTNVLVGDFDAETFLNNPFFVFCQSADPDEPAEGADKPGPETTRTEQQVRLIWGEVLKSDTIGPDDNFFKLGGHSLIGARIIARIGEKLGVVIKFKDLLEHPTTRLLAGAIEEQLRTATGTDHAGIVPVAPQAFYDVSHGQKRLWLLNQMAEAKTTFNISKAYHFRGDLNVAAFRQAFAQLVKRHESLRTTFSNVNGVLKQQIRDAECCGFEVTVADIRDQSSQEAVDRLIGETARVAFDLAEGPLLLARLLRTMDDEWVFLFTMHHIVSDGWSMEVLIKEVLTCYNAYTRNAPDPLLPLRVHYKDYAAWQNGQLEGEGAQAHKSYWLDRFGGQLPVLNLKTDYPRPPVKTYQGHTLRFTLPEALSRAVTDACEQYQVSPYVFVLAALKALLYRYTGQSDLVVGSPSAGRNHVDLENQIGFYVNMLALRTRFNGREPFENLLLLVKETVVEATEHNIYPFDLLVKELHLKRDLSRSALFDVGFTWNSKANVGGHVELDFLAEEYTVDYATPKGDIWFHGSQAAHELMLEIEYAKDLFREETMMILFRRLEQLLRGVVADPRAALDDIDLHLETEPVRKVDMGALEFNF